MAGDSRFSEISEFLAELLVDTHPSLPSSCPEPDIAGGGVFAAGDVIWGDPSSQNVSFLPQGIGISDRGEIPPVLGGPPDQELVLLPTSDSSGEAYSDPLMSLNNRLSPGEGSSSTASDDSRDSDPILKYINQLLMEEDKEVNSWLSGDETALQNTEKSFYDALGEKYPQLPEQNLDLDASHLVDSTTLGKGCDLGSMGGAATGISSSDSVDPSFRCSPGEFIDHAFLNSSYFGDETVQPIVESLLNPSSVIIDGIGDDFRHSDATEVLAKHMFKDTDSVMQFKKGLEEASKFLPNTTQIFRNLDDSSTASELQEIEIQPANGELSKGLKNHVRDGSWVEDGRASKQTAVTGDESGISDMFDRVLLDDTQALSNESSGGSLKNSLSPEKKRTSKGNKVRVKKQTSKSTNVDLRSLLALCAEAVNSHDLRTAHELLKQIRENSRPTGDGSERLAHYFANGLEARIAGNEGDARVFFMSTMFKKTSAADMLKAYHTYITACPFMKFPILFSCHIISQLAVNAEVLHIIDFGMAFGFHWPIIIQKLSERPAGPPKLRMTGIEYPAPGFRPAQRIEEAGRRLAQYCDRFRVPFEFNAVASQEWESIKIEDLKIQSGEMIAVNCLNRFKNLLDDMGEEDSPRDAVLDLIRRINPDIFVNSTPSGAYNSPFFLTRFREALLHHSALYDMLDLTMSSDSYERQIIEREFHGREILNVIACEGRERTSRVIWLDRPMNRTVDPRLFAEGSGDQINLVLSKPLHGCCLFEVIKLLPEFAGLTDRTPLMRATEPPSERAPQMIAQEITVVDDANLLNGKKVLVADDSAINRRIAEKYLKKLGASVFLCEDGANALELVRVGLLEQKNSQSSTMLPYDYILMDCQMPGMDGYEATTRIREEEKRYGVHTPIIALTAHDSGPEARRIFEVGMDYHLKRPLKEDHLLEAIASLRGG